MTHTPSARVTVADFIAARLAESEKTQREIAEECGFENPNIISMLKNGSTKVPLARVPALAQALDADKAHFLRVVMSEYFPDVWGAIEELTRSTILTAKELVLVRRYRDVAGDRDADVTLVSGDALVGVLSV